MAADGNCEFLVVAHIIHGREPVWPEVCQRLLDHPNRNPTGRLHDITVTPGVVASLHSLSGEPYALRWPIWDRSKWVDSDKHAQLTTDAYDVFVAIVYSNVVI